MRKHLHQAARKEKAANSSQNQRPVPNLTGAEGARTLRLNFHNSHSNGPEKKIQETEIFPPKEQNRAKSVAHTKCPVVENPSGFAYNSIEGGGVVGNPSCAIMGESAYVYDLPSVIEEFRTGAMLAASISQARRNARVVEEFISKLAIRSFHEFTPRAVQVYLLILKEDGRAPKTIRNHHGSLSQFFQYLIGRGLLAENPAETVKLPRMPRKLPLYLTDNEYRCALSLAYRHGFYIEMALALNTGMRMSEMRLLRWADVEERRVYVRDGKGDKDRMIPLNKMAQKVLARRRRIVGHLDFVFPARQTFTGGFKWKNAARNSSWWVRAIVPIQQEVAKFRQRPKGSVGRGWHLLRHTFASRAAQNGVSIYKLSKWLGHSTVATTMIYAHLSDEWDEDIEKV